MKVREIQGFMAFPESRTKIVCIRVSIYLDTKECEKSMDSTVIVIGFAKVF